MPISRQSPKSIARTIQIINAYWLLCCLISCFYLFTSEHTGWALSKRPINTYKHILRGNTCLPGKVYFSRFVLLMSWTIGLLKDYCSYSRVTKLFIKGNCPGKWCQRLSSNLNCSDNYFGLLSIYWICWDTCLRRLSINWNCLNNIHVWYFLTIGIVRSNDSGVSVSWSFPDIWFQRLTIRIAWPTNVWCFLLIRTVQRNYLEDGQ